MSLMQRFNIVYKLFFRDGFFIREIEQVTEMDRYEIEDIIRISLSLRPSYFRSKPVVSRYVINSNLRFTE